MADGLITHATIHHVALPTRAALHAAHDEQTDAGNRELVYVAVHLDGDLGTAAGWGECSALNAPTYTPEWTAGAYASLASGTAPSPATEPMASAALEMALLDVDLRRADQSLAHRLGTAGSSAPAGAVVGLNPIPAMLDQVAELAQLGYRRIKAKIVPGRVVEPIRAIIDRFPDIEVQVDANGSLRIDDIGLLMVLRDLGVSVIEQPFAIGDHRAATRLVADTDLTVLADEAVRHVDDAIALARDQAATGLVVKPPTLGGLAAALDLLDTAQTLGLRCSIGGMLESGLGRNQLAALAPLPAFTVIGDLSPAGRWLAVDPFEDIIIVDGQIPAPNQIGVAGDPDLDVLAAHRIASATIPVEVRNEPSD